MSRVPNWMAQQTGSVDWETSPFAGGPARRAASFAPLKRAIASIAATVADLAAGRDLAEAPGLLQDIDARAKVIGILVLIFTATLVHRPATLVLVYLVALTAALASRIPFSRLLRAWLAVPLFSAAIVLPATLNVVTPGAPVLVLWRTAGHSIGPIHLPDYLAITAPGLYLAGRFVLRIAVCVTLALLLTATTKSENLFRGLRGIGVPRLFVMLLGMMQRYLVVLLRVAEEIHLAKRSRSITAGTLREEQAWVGAGVGTLFRRTLALGDDIYLAMLSRGYTGEVHLLDDPPMRAADIAFLAACVILALMMFALR